ncbi:MAG: rRNA pseudouridine synthase [Erysipelotrichaceae bacterium]|nr:rRNA pseudouridine synthase [Erysipelotrichaceae bacterium]
MRLDKFLAHSGFGTRKEVKQLIKEYRVTVNDQMNVKDKTQIDETADIIKVDGAPIIYETYTYVMLNKPAGVISATDDCVHETIMDCLEGVFVKGMFPFGRLDKDSEGLLIISNDGKLAHRLLSPKHHVDKEYEVHLDTPLTKDDLRQIAQGIQLKDFTTKPAIVKEYDDCILHLTIQEGKFHQIKRMMEALGHNVVYLKRIRFGDLWLDESLDLGEWRYLSEDEIQQLRRNGEQQHETIS